MCPRIRSGNIQASVSVLLDNKIVFGYSTRLNGAARVWLPAAGVNFLCE